MQWVKANIAKFGGDADNITIFGQSAGSQSVCSLMVSPLAQGLFHKAIGQSASCTSPLAAADKAGLHRGAKLAEALGVGNKLRDLRAVAPQQLMDAASASGWEAQSRIVIDGWVVPDSQDALYAAGQQAKIPLLLGYLSNEGEELLPLNSELSAEHLSGFLTMSLGADLVKDALKLYQAELSQSPGVAQHAIMTDQFMGYGMLRWANYQASSNSPTYYYHMDHQPPAFRLYNPDNPDLQLEQGPRSGGAYHSGDLAYVFGTTRKVGHDWTEQDHQISEQIMQYWTNFAKTGSPNGAGLPKWQVFDANSLATQFISSNTHSVKGVQNAKMALFQQRFKTQ